MSNNTTKNKIFSPMTYRTEKNKWYNTIAEILESIVYTN